SPTISGGETQRIKLFTELANSRPVLDAPADALSRRGAGRRAASVEPHTLYVLDEPTIGLHMADVEKLIRVLHRLVAAGNSVIVIEHNLDVIAEAHWVVDLGPEGGAGGGRVVAAGPPHEIVRKPGRSHTARHLAEFLAERSPGRVA
ncbi:MAG: excinuclease ABC subunit A, partial [Gammaproteobacteria bacterium]